MKHHPAPLTAILVVTVLAGTLSSTANAESDRRQIPEKEETVGLMSGALIGAAAGGPPGAVVGAALGIFVGDGWITKREYRDIEAALISLQLEADEARAQLASLRGENREAQAELARLRDAPVQVLPAFLSSSPDAGLFNDSSISLHFRTGSSTVEAHYQAQLTALAAIAERLPTGAIEVSGYADRSGNADANLRLSESRTASVKSFIEGLGLDSGVITTVAYGESRPLHDTQSVETDFFDRRVIVRLVDTSEQLLTGSRED
jgi:sortase system peptidoglycan-associated protein